MSKKYRAVWTETLSREAEIEAESIEEALAKAEDFYRSGIVVLDSSDYTEAEIMAEDRIAGTVLRANI